MDGKKYPLQAKLRNLFVSLDKLYETHFHDVVVFVIKTSTMANPGYWTIIKLWYDKQLHENGAVFQADAFRKPY